MKKFIVALEVGGLLEQPELDYYNFKIVEAETEKEAEEIYNMGNKCDNAYVTVLGEYYNEEVILTEWYKNRLIEENEDAKIYGIINDYYSDHEDTVRWYSGVLISSESNLDETKYELIGAYSSKFDMVLIDYKHISAINAIANYRKEAVKTR